MKDRLEWYTALSYSVRIVPDRYPDGRTCYFARVEELPGCESHGDTVEEARANLNDALALYLASMLEDGLEPPMPRSAATSVVWQSATSVTPTAQVTRVIAPTARLQPA